MDLQALADRLGLEVDEFTELAELFLQTGADELVGIRAALAAGDADTVAKKVHSLKGAAGNLGFMDLHHLAQDLEGKAREGKPGEVESLLQSVEAQLSRLRDALTRN